MIIDAEQLKKIVVEPDYISEANFNTAVEIARAEKKDVDEVLMDKNFIRESELGQLIANALGAKFADLKKQKIDGEVFKQIPEAMARSRGVVAFTATAKSVQVGMVDPTDRETIHFLEQKFGKTVAPFLITRRSFIDSLSRYASGLSDALTALLQKVVAAPGRAQKEAVTVEIVDTLLLYGYQNKASDIHIEPETKKVVVRFRLDGVMHDVAEVPVALYDLILTRIKILAKLRTDEHRAAQDGKLNFVVQSGAVAGRAMEPETIDVRVSIAPTVKGENAVLRLLTTGTGNLYLEDLGLSDKNFAVLSRAIKTPVGMILVTGPTGSGKTTTLYAVLKILNKREVNIATIEDPVEYAIDGVTQIQVNAKTNLTFANGLRSLVRQDPNIIMVGEIRDEETADIAVNAAMTGHLVLSTLHTNDAATTLPRLLDMGIEPFLVASTVRLIVAQRLVRKICESCRASASFSPEEIETISLRSEFLNLFTAKGKKDLSKIRTYKGTGCLACAQTGFRGRIGIFEVLEMNAEIKDLIIKRTPSDIITAAACKAGMTTMLEDGVDKVLAGVTTIGEVLRVTV